MQPKLFWSTSNMIETNDLLMSCGAFWLYCEEKRSAERLLVFVDKLLKLGVRFFHVSGESAIEVHDRIDDIIIDHEYSNTLTTWNEGSINEAAEEFWDLTLTSFDKMGIIVFASNISREIEIVTEILKATNKKFKMINH